MPLHENGLLLSQLLDSVSRPLEEEQVWALCFHISQSLVNSDPDGTVQTALNVTFSVEVIYLRRDGKVIFIFIPNSNYPGNDAEEIRVSVASQMNDLNTVLDRCLENHSPKKFLKRQVGSDLESMMRHLARGEYSNDGGEWLNVVADCCVRHATSQTTAKSASRYYTEIFEQLLKEGIEINNFLTTTRCESNEDAIPCTFEICPSRAVISNWLQCMSEIRDATHKKHDELRSPDKPIVNSYYPSRFTEIHYSPRSALPTIDEDSGCDIELSKPSHHSTPTPRVICDKTRKKLRPPQRLVNQVTSLILEGEPRDNACDYDVSWLSGKRFSPVTSSLGWFCEAKRIRRVLTELQIDTAMEYETLYNSLCNGEICFCCQVKFSFFRKSHLNCEVCERKVCASCITFVIQGDLEMVSRDSTRSSHDSGLGSREIESIPRDYIDDENRSIFGQLRKLFRNRGNSAEEKHCKMCKDCKDFIQMHF